MIKKKNIILLLFVLLVLLFSFELFAFEISPKQENSKYSENKIRVGVLDFYSDTLNKGQLDKIVDASSRSFLFREDIEVVSKKVRDTVLANANLLKTNVIARPELCKKIADFLNVAYLIYGTADVEKKNLVKIRFFLYEKKSDAVIATSENIGFSFKGGLEQIPSVIYKFASDISNVDSDADLLKKKYKLTELEYKQLSEKIKSMETETASNKDYTAGSNKKVKDLESTKNFDDQKIKELEKTINDLKKEVSTLKRANAKPPVTKQPATSSTSLKIGNETKKEDELGMEPTVTTTTLTKQPVKKEVPVTKNASQSVQVIQTPQPKPTEESKAAPTETPLAVVNKPVPTPDITVTKPDDSVSTAPIKAVPIPPVAKAGKPASTPAAAQPVIKTLVSTPAATPVKEVKPQPENIEVKKPEATPQPKPKEAAKTAATESPTASPTEKAVSTKAKEPVSSPAPADTAVNIAEKNKQEAKKLYDEVQVLPLKSQEALEKTRRAVQLDPTNIAYTGALALIYFENGDFDNAIIQCTNALKLNPENAPVHTLLGSIYYEQSKFEDAASEHRIALKYNPMNYNAQYNLALTLMEIDQNAALTEWENYIKIAKNIPSQTEWVNKANAYINQIKGSKQ